MRVSHLGGKHFQAKSFTLRCGISDKPRASEFTLIKKKKGVLTLKWMNITM